MKAIIIAGYFLVNTVDYEHNQYNYLLSYEESEKLYLIAYNDEKRYQEQKLIKLKLKLDCEQIGGKKGNIFICNTIQK